MIAVDTNVLIRLAVDDDRQQSEVAARLVRDNRLSASVCTLPTVSRTILTCKSYQAQ